MKKLFAGILTAACLAGAACTDPAVSGYVPDTGETQTAQTTAAAEDMVFTTPFPEDADEDFVHIDVQTPVPVSPVPIFSATPGPAETFSYSGGDTIEVRYYDMEAQEARSTQYPVRDAGDPQAVLDGVQAAFRDVLGPQNLKINSATYSDGNLFIDFDPSIYTLGIGSAGEREVLESVADTYLTNIDGIQAVYYTVDGAPYQSENVQLNENEAYKSVLSVDEIP